MDCGTSDRLVDDLRTEIRYLDERISSTKSLLRRFRTRRKEATNTLKSRLDQISSNAVPLRAASFQMLPPELISYILVDAAKSSASCVYLCHINHRTRSIAFSTPAMWQDIQLFTPQPPPETLKMHSWISRTGSLPLSLTTMALSLDHQELLDAFSLGASRIRYLDMQLAHLPTMASLNVTSWDRLSRLSLVNRQPWACNHMQARFGTFAVCPNLTSLTLHIPRTRIHLAMFDLPWHQLRHLSLSTYDPPEAILHTISRCQNLETLDVYFRLPRPDFPILSTPITLPFLRSFSLETRLSEPQLLRILRHFTLPSVVHLALDIDDHAGSVWDGLDLFFRSQPFSLQSLYLNLRWIGETPGIIAAIANLQSSLVSLEVKVDMGRCLCPIENELAKATSFARLESFILWAPGHLINVARWKDLCNRREKGACESHGVVPIKYWRIWSKVVDHWTGADTYRLDGRKDYEPET